MQHDYYKEYYELERNHWWFVAREKILTQYIKKCVSEKQLTPNLKILNIGCGPGRSSEYLSQFGTVVSVEYDTFCCEFAREKTGLEIINGSITELPFNGEKFDLVCAFDVIEHVEDDMKAVAEMKRVAKKDGMLLVTVPAFMSLWSHHDEVNQHFRRYKLKQLHQLFTTTGNGKAIYTSYFNFFLFPPVYAFRRLSRLLKFKNKRKGSGSDFETWNPGFINTVLFKIMFSESKLINRAIKLPFGVSILYSWQKKSAN